jgi:hypothetical protein
MAFNFNWTEFDDDFHQEATKMVTLALNKGNKPARIKGDIQVKELHMGTQVSYACLDSTLVANLFSFTSRQSWKCWRLAS